MLIINHKQRRFLYLYARIMRMYVMLDFICVTSPSCEEWKAS